MEAKEPRAHSFLSKPCTPPDMLQPGVEAQPVQKSKILEWSSFLSVRLYVSMSVVCTYVCNYVCKYMCIYRLHEQGSIRYINNPKAQ